MTEERAVVPISKQVLPVDTVLDVWDGYSPCADSDPTLSKRIRTSQPVPLVYVAIA